ncbi:MAG: CopD family protein [Candidatus Sulfobium sp.]|jgi:copper transport protein
MDLTYAAMILFYWIFLSCIFFIAGSYASRVLVTDPSGADVCYLPGKRQCLGETSAHTIFLVSILALIADALYLILQASVISDTPLKGVYSVIIPFLLETRYGKFSVIRTCLLAAVLVMSYSAAKRAGRRISFAGAALSFLILLSLSMSGHQGTRRGSPVPLFIDVFHIGAVSLWIGGLFYIRFCYTFFMRQAGVEFFAIFRNLMARFSRMATACVFIGASAGVGLGFINVKRLSYLINAPYGRVLLLKALIVGVLISLGGINKFILLPRLDRSGAEQWTETATYRSWLRRVITAEVVTAMVVLLLTSILTHLSPEG